MMSSTSGINDDVVKPGNFIPKGIACGTGFATADIYMLVIFLNYIAISMSLCRFINGGVCI